MYNDEFLQIRDDAYEFMHEQEETVFRKWWEQCHLGEMVFSYEMHYCSPKKLTIYTNKSGIMIGFKGKNVDILKSILFEVFESEVDIEFKEIKGRFVHIKDINISIMN